MQRGADYLLFELADAIVADFMPCLDALDDAANGLEDEVFNNPMANTLNRIFTLKRAAIHLRRILSPQREVLNRLARDEYRPIDAKERIYFRGVYDHMVRLNDINESLRDLISGALDIYLSAVSNRLNEVMRILTLVDVVVSSFALHHLTADEKRGLLRSVASRLRPGGWLVNADLVVSEWPDHPVMHLQPRFPTAVGFAGASFPLLAHRFTLSEPSSSIPEIRRQGDAILELVRIG